MTNPAEARVASCGITQFGELVVLQEVHVVRVLACQGRTPSPLYSYAKESRVLARPVESW